MAAGQSKKLVWDSAEFTKMYSLAEKFTGDYAEDLLQQADFATQADALSRLVVLDTACGTGIVSNKIMKLLSVDAKSKLDLTCADFADSMVDFVTSMIEKNSWTHAKALKADAQDTKLPADHFTHVFFNFGPMLLPDGNAGLKECYRLLQPGGVLGFTTWKKVGWIAEVRAAFETNPDLPKFPSNEEVLGAFSSSPARWNTEAEVEKHLKTNHFVNIKVTAVHKQTNLTVDEFVSIIPGTLGLITARMWNEEQRNKHKESAAKTTETYMRNKYGDKTITWDWTAIVATANKPE